MHGRVLRVGVNLPQFDVDFEAGRACPDTFLRYARQCEELGFDSVWMGDHVFARAPDGTVCAGLEAAPALAAVAAGTGRIGIGTLVLGLSLRSIPEVAGIAAALEAVAPDRVTAGIGAGWNPHTHRALGVALSGYGTRARVLTEAAAALDSLPERPRLLVGGWGDAVLVVAAAHADVANVAWDVSPAAFRHVGARLDAQCEAAGRDPESLARSVGLTVLCAADERAARRLVSRVSRRAAFLSGLTLESVRDSVAVVGDPDTCAGSIDAYGADEVVLMPFVRDDPELLAVLAEDVLPALGRSAPGGS